jgi:hypothetical protein
MMALPPIGHATTRDALGRMRCSTWRPPHFYVNVADDEVIPLAAVQALLDRMEARLTLITVLGQPGAVADAAVNEGQRRPRSRTFPSDTPPILRRRTPFALPMPSRDRGSRC